MCDCGSSRREVLVGAAIGAAALAIGGRAAAAPGDVAADAPAEVVMPGLAIYPRTAWGADLVPKAPPVREDARFLLVHHTASSNTYTSARSVIRGTYAWQTSKAKGWKDVCYQFFIGRDGDVWEGREGAMAGPVVADATGGSQGFAQLVCLLGDFTSVRPTAAAQDSLVKVLAWLAGRHGIAVEPGATTSFVSRGSQRWAAGVPVTSSTIAGHRDMSYTACPGDLFYPMIADLRVRVSAQHEAWRHLPRPARRVGPANA
jgi:N-acetylmuramoyl-L-alanine amidase